MLLRFHMCSFPVIDRRHNVMAEFLQSFPSHFCQHSLSFRCKSCVVDASTGAEQPISDSLNFELGAL